MHRFFSPTTHFQNSDIEIVDRDEVHHLKTVLRLKVGDSIIIFNGSGQEALGEIIQLSPKSALIHLTTPVKKTTLNSITVTLACAIPKKAKFETIIEKCTELGVDIIIPMITARTEVHLSTERQDSKLKRYQTVAINAAKQSQRTFIPRIGPILTLNELLKKLTPSDLAFIPCLSGKRESILTALKIPNHISNLIFLIGPEGDFTDEELKKTLQAGCKPLTLGPHTLKVDTAAICSIAIAKLTIENNRADE